MVEPKRLPNGRWEIRYRDPEVRARRAVYHTKGDARAYLEEVGHALRHRTWVAPERGRILFAVGQVGPVHIWTFRMPPQSHKRAISQTHMKHVPMCTTGLYHAKQPA